PGTSTYSTIPSNTAFSGVSTDSWKSAAMFRSSYASRTGAVRPLSRSCCEGGPARHDAISRVHQGELLALGDHFLDRPAHVERLLGHFVQIAVHDHLEALDRV